jgi:putative ABC transport system permease protein
MIKNYLLSAARNFRRNKLHTFINIVGLGLGLMAGFLAIMFVLHEQSFDQFHTKRDRLYRLNKINIEPGGGESLTAETSGMMGPTLVEEFPEVEAAVRFRPWWDEIVLSNDEKNVVIKEQWSAFADSTFFLVFDFDLLRGDPKNVLVRPQTIVLTETLAKSLFGDEDPIGKSVIGMEGTTFEITGIVATPPSKSHIQFEALMSWSTTTPQLGSIPMDWMNNWIAQGINTYVLMKDLPAGQPGTTSEQVVESKLPKFMSDHMPTRADKYRLYLQPFNEVYLNSYNVMSGEMQKSGNQQYIYMFSVIAGFVLAIACINYINISTSKATRRAREVGMRKTLGASRRQLVYQFLGESFLITALSVSLALLLMFFAIPHFNELAGKELTMSLLLDPRVTMGIVTLMVVVAVASGLYPSFIISAFKPAAVLKASQGGRLTGNWARYTLITFQFAISIVMIAGTLLVRDQIHFVMSKDLGFDKEHILVVNLTDDVAQHRDVLQNNVDAFPGVLHTSVARTALGQGGASTYIVPEGFGPDEIEVRMFPVDGNFLETYDLKMADGHFFEPGSSRDSGSFIINEALARRLKWDEPLQKTIRFAEDQPAQPIIGVLKDFNYFSLYDEVDPLVMWVSARTPRRLSVRFTGDPSPLVEFLGDEWKKYEARYPFNYFFLDQQLAQSYASEKKLFETVLTFAGLSIVVACLGLYGLVSYTIEQRTKEFGIRKVLGASVASLNFLVNRKFVMLTCLAAVVAIPAVVPLMNDWLEKFAFRISIGPGVFIFAVMITLAITVLAVSIQAIKVAMTNPADALRHE